MIHAASTLAAQAAEGVRMSVLLGVAHTGRAAVSGTLCVLFPRSHPVRVYLNGRMRLSIDNIKQLRG